VYYCGINKYNNIHDIIILLFVGMEKSNALHNPRVQALASHQLLTGMHERYSQT